MLDCHIMLPLEDSQGNQRETVQVQQHETKSTNAAEWRRTKL